MRKKYEVLVAVGEQPMVIEAEDWQISDRLELVAGGLKVAVFTQFVYIKTLPDQ